MYTLLLDKHTLHALVQQQVCCALVLVGPKGRVLPPPCGTQYQDLPARYVIHFAVIHEVLQHGTTYLHFEVYYTPMQLLYNSWCLFDMHCFSNTAHVSSDNANRLQCDNIFAAL